jgi:hypothetical protein
MPLEGMVTGIGDPLHAIDEPATRGPPPSLALPHIHAAQHANGFEVTRCNVWCCEASLLADCWQVRCTDTRVGRQQRYRRAGPGDVPRGGVSAAVMGPVPSDQGPTALMGLDLRLTAATARYARPSLDVPLAEPMSFRAGRSTRRRCIGHHDEQEHQAVAVGRGEASMSRLARRRRRRSCAWWSGSSAIMVLPPVGIRSGRGGAGTSVRRCGRHCGRRRVRPGGCRSSGWGRSCR